MSNPILSNWRPLELIDDLRPMLLAERSRLNRFAMATLVEVDGPSPRDIGAQMLITDNQHWGFLSGGCIEADVARHGREAIAAGGARLLRYGQGSPWIDIKLACGAGITVLVEPVVAGEAAIDALLSAYVERTPVLWHSDGQTRTVQTESGGQPSHWNGSTFTQYYAPALRLVIIGADAAALASAKLAMEFGLDVAMVTPNGPQHPPLDGISYFRSTAVEALAKIGLDRWTAVAIITHDRDDDERALAFALKSDAFYVGAIGSRARLENRLDRLRQEGVSEMALSQLHAPIGVQGFGKSPIDIALSIIADVKRDFHSRSATAKSPAVSTSNIAPISSVSR